MSISQGRATTPAPVSSRCRKPTFADFRPQPGGGEAFALNPSMTASPPGGTRAIFAHGFAIGRLVDVQYTAASAVSPCPKIATVAHAGLVQSFPSS
jgi:hypothetical protein